MEGVRRFLAEEDGFSASVLVRKGNGRLEGDDYVRDGSNAKETITRGVRKRCEESFR